jgi:16S rRNA (guanine527-N7)-methyltransferase
MTEMPTSVPNFAQLETLLQKYFPNQISEGQMIQFRKAFEGYIEWNAKINVISRKDMENLAERHFLHSLAIAKSIQFKSGTKVLDVGTGGGFPGIPLAIFFPECEFLLVDSRFKKIQVVDAIVALADLKNVHTTIQRVEDMTDQHDFVVSRAVAALDQFIPWVRKRIHCRSHNDLANGILYLRGEGAQDELSGLSFKQSPVKTPISTWFEEEFFQTKELLHLSFC